MESLNLIYLIPVVIGGSQCRVPLFTFGDAVVGKCHQLGNPKRYLPHTDFTFYYVQLNCWCGYIMESSRVKRFDFVIDCASSFLRTLLSVFFTGFLPSTTCARIRRTCSGHFWIPFSNFYKGNFHILLYFVVHCVYVYP